DFMFRLNPPAAACTGSILLTIDDATLTEMGGVRSLRTMFATALERLVAANPKLVVLDSVLADPGDPVEDARLERAFANTPNLVLATILADGHWENPRPMFSRSAVAIGHALADQQSPDGVTRQIPLAIASGRERHWSLSLEAFRISRGVKTILESPDDLQVGDTVIPARYSSDRSMRIRYLRSGIPQISLKDLLHKPELLARFHDRAVFLGIYSTTAARDRVFTPFEELIPGVEVNAEAFETLNRGDFFVDAWNSAVPAFCLIIAVLAGVVFAYFSGYTAYLLGGLLLLLAHIVPFALFRERIVFPYFAPLSSAWLTAAGAAVYQHFVVRRELRKSEDERTRYRQAIHFVTHEMRTPLTSIQGSSELIGRYNLNDDKRKQIAQMINSESKRLSRMIQTFLDVERLSDGQMELKNEVFEARELVQACLDRVRPIADRKSIALRIDGLLAGTMRGDRELMEYAVYNLLTNAVKYSSSGTEVAIASRPIAGELRLSIKDQGMGLEEHEVRKIFQRFYRTKRAEASGEVGSGIGLSIVDQIVRHHAGRMEVVSAPQQGSCFTIIVPAFVRDERTASV
ncbi:MAG: CHASE2 domain-containing protein, partial [Acidobacteriaceae bacterium]|nr:CHASE2 domain-containing protein [Acidobacteriaceae bacterium]